MDFSEFVDGLSIFIKGNSEEKLTCKCSFFLKKKKIKKSNIFYSVSFKLYDVNHDGFLTKTELERVMLKLVKYACFLEEKEENNTNYTIVLYLFKR